MSDTPVAVIGGGVVGCAVVYTLAGRGVGCVLLVGIVVAIWWVMGANKRYTGPVRTIDEAPMDLDEKPETGPAPTPAS